MKNFFDPFRKYATILRMFRCVADVTVFLTPFEDGAASLRKIEKSREMFDSYAMGSGLGLVRSERTDGRYRTRSYADSAGLVELRFSWREDLPPKDRFPAAFANFFLAPANFPKEGVESFVNDAVGFLTGVFGRECFVDADSAYEIRDANAGKEADVDDLESFDLKDPKSSKNKDLLDTLCQLRFTLLKNALGIESNAASVA